MEFAFVCDLEGNDMLLIESSRREPCKKLSISLPLPQSCVRLRILLTREVTEFAALLQKFGIADFLQPGVFSGPVEAPRFGLQSFPTGRIGSSFTHSPEICSYRQPVRKRCRCRAVALGAADHQWFGHFSRARKTLQCILPSANFLWLNTTHRERERSAGFLGRAR